MSAKNNTGLDISKDPPWQLFHYEGNFTDSDGDVMTDLAEVKYGYDPTNPESFPNLDFLADPIEELSIEGSTFNNSRIVQTDQGIRLIWDNNQSVSDYGRYSLTLENGSEELYHGGHEWEEAEVPFEEFQLVGTEILKGSFTESDPETGKWITDHNEFEIDLSDFPLPPTDSLLADEKDKIFFRFNGFNEEQKKQYTDFMSKVIPIIEDFLGNPAETFVCDFNMDNESHNSWVTLDQGRSILMNDAWLPRLLVHEMIHMWKGKYAFSYSDDNWGYSDDLSGFEEIAEGLAYEILHDFVEAYPYDHNTRLILEGGPWWNWSSGSANFDIIKHQKHTGGGTFWSGEALFEDDRYSIAAMTIQTILRHKPDFIKNTLRHYYDQIEEDSTFRPTRDNLIEIWTSQIDKINGIDSRDFLESIPIFRGRKLAQQYYPVIFQNETNSHGTTKTIFGSYAVDGNMWWSLTPENIANFNIPQWVNYHLDQDGYYYIDSNDLNYEVITQNIFGEEQSSFKGILDAGYQNENETIPNNLFNERIDALDSSNLPQGLYLENLTFTDLSEHTKNANETFYSFGYADYFQEEEEYSLFIGVNSKFAEKITLSFRDYSFNEPLINGCAIIKTTEIPHNAEGILSISVQSFDQEHNYTRALNNAGSYDGLRHQQFLIIDRDFDGIEDLYDPEINQTEIEEDYENYKYSHPGHRKMPDLWTVEINSTTGGFVEIIGLPNDQKAETGTSISIRATADDGYKFEKWTGDFESTSMEANFTVTSDLEITAHFSQLINQSIIWESGDRLGNGWGYLKWFGYYLKTPSNWVYHTDHGWIFSKSEDPGSVWYMDSKLGWCWTSQNLYPYIYARRNGWLYFNRNSQIPDREFYDFSKESWIKP